MRLGFAGILFVAIAPWLVGQEAGAQDLDSVKGILKAQVEAWNRGDLEGFMKGYLPSEKLMFIGSRGLTYGWKQTLANYKKSYPDLATMGKLTFTILEMKPLGDSHMLVIGKWHLARDQKEDAEGHFSLTWQKIDGHWFIIADHSS